MSRALRARSELEPEVVAKMDSMRVAAIAAPVRTQVAEMLRQAITTGRFEPGRRLIEKELCELLGVSRPSVREALRDLEAEGLIHTFPNRGPVVAKLEIKDAVGIYQIRGVLEALAAKLFCENATDEDIANLEQKVELLAEAYRGGELDVIIGAKAKFYEVLLKGAANPLIPNFLRVINGRIIQLRRISLMSEQRMQSSIKEIKRIMAAIKRRDRDAAFAATLEHIEAAAKAGIAQLAQHAQDG